MNQKRACEAPSLTVKEDPPAPVQSSAEFGAWMMNPQNDKWRQQNNIREGTPLHVSKLAFLRWREEQKAEAAV